MIEVTERAEERWTNMVNRGAASPLSFGESSYYFGTNIPGKPKRYLLNSGGRPKLFSVIADVIANDYDSFTFSGDRPDGRHRLTHRSSWSTVAGHTVAIGVTGEPTMPGMPQRRRGQQEAAAAVLAQPRRQLVQIPHLARAGRPA